MYAKKDLITFFKIKELINKGINVKAIKKVFKQGELSLEVDVEILDSLKEILKVLKS